MSKTTSQDQNKIFSPKAFMRERHPLRFSDSKIIKENKLNRTLLEYHLEFLSSNKKENDFEEFARKLSQYEICPNLRKQTGPTGGGDSKADSENIPVSTQILLKYYHGEDSQTKEKYAFAFSTKQKWTDKVRKDAKEIIDTKRGYSRIYFITSQFARDKTRALIEDEFYKKHKIKLIILDKNWILDKIFLNKREKLAIEELHLDTDLEEKILIGPLDYKRKQRFDNLNRAIGENISSGNITTKTVGNALKTALIALELEIPRQDIDGLFDRAMRLAKNYGVFDQFYTAIYQKAWNTFFIFEDYKKFIEIYDEVEKEALKSRNIFVYERLHNLWTLLNVLAFKSRIVSKSVATNKLMVLTDKLERFTKDETNLSAAVQAKLILCLIDLTLNITNKQKLQEAFKKMHSLVDESKKLIGFPLQTVVKILNQSDDIFSGLREYENLQDQLLKIVTEREGEVSAAKLLLERGLQHLKSKRYYKAIDYFGRTSVRFYKEESKDYLVESLYLISIAYEDVGLLWASRSALLSAASFATSDLWTHSEINTMQLACYSRLKFIELRLGRIGYALEWHSLERTLGMHISVNEDDRNRILENSLFFGSVLGLLIIKTPDSELKTLEKLPDTLFSLDLDFAAYGLIYRLGGKDLLPPRFKTSIKMNIDDFF